MKDPESRPASRSPAPDPTIRRELFLSAPQPGISVVAGTYYAEPEGTRLLSLHQHMSKSDLVDGGYLRVSDDNGRTWGEAAHMVTEEVRPGGRLRRAPRYFQVHPATARLLYFWCEAWLPGDDPLAGMRQWRVCYRISEDGGRTWGDDRTVKQVGDEYDADHPLPGVWIGRNCVMLGDTTSIPLMRRDGTVLLSVQLSPLGPDGVYHNPGNSFTYTEVAVVHGRWNQAGTDLEWQLSERVQMEPARSTRGMIEPTLAELADGRLLMIMRGSNDVRPELPGWRWAAWSEDGGHHWSAPEPWTYDDGQRFHSPSSCSQLVAHSTGRIFWLGNITPTNPQGNRPRYPLVIGEVDAGSGLLRRDSIRVVDDRRPEDSPLVTLSNFAVREDRETGELILNMSRLFSLSQGDVINWTSDAGLYRIPIK